MMSYSRILCGRSLYPYTFADYGQYALSIFGIMADVQNFLLQVDSDKTAAEAVAQRTANSTVAIQAHNAIINADFSLQDLSQSR